MIPEIDVRVLTAKKQTEGALAFSFTPEAELLDIPFTAFEGEAEAKLSYRIFEDNSAEVTGSVSFTLAGLCSRCLSEARMRVTGNVEGLYFRGGSDGENYGYTGGKIDLTELLRDSVMFALPARLLCEGCLRQENE